MRLQRALWVACGARSEIEECRIVGGGIDIFKAVPRGFEGRGQGRRIGRRAIDQEDVLHRGREKSCLLDRR